eukprot:5642627-Pyramimonas_sp.AAC.1
MHLWMREAGWEALNANVFVGLNGEHHHLTSTPPAQIAKAFISDLRSQFLKPALLRALSENSNPRALEIRERGLWSLGPRRLLASKKFPKEYKRVLVQVFT